ncbi:MAG: ATP-dependent ligase [Xanthobacteraceae bacterium]|nr:ATP-dependent ligase [Xanthobacteraceae bacterium]
MAVLRTMWRRRLPLLRPRSSSNEKSPRPIFPERGLSYSLGQLFVEPQLVAEIEFRGWTDEPKLRHASFKGLREAADHTEVMELDA